MNKEVEKTYNRIDKIAKKGKDQVQEYYKLIDELIDNGYYESLEQCLFIFYGVDINKYPTIFALKKKSWPLILFKTSTSFSKKLKKIYDDREVYQVGFNVYQTTVGLTMSTPMSTTYSVTASTQSITPTLVSNNIYLSTDDANVYQFSISKATWVDNIPTVIGDTQNIQAGTSSASLTEIPVTFGHEYLISSYSRNSTTQLSHYQLNYKFSVETNTLIGTIKEIDTFTQESKYYLKNREFSKAMGTSKVYLDVQKTTDVYALRIEVNNPNQSADQNLLNRYKIAIDYLLS
jgi:hypothetical protein